MPERGAENENLLLSAHQWSECVSKSVMAFDQMDESCFIRIRYEELVSDPDKTFRDILTFAGESVPENLEDFVAAVRKTSIGKGRKQMADEYVETIRPWITNSMERLGYQI